MRMRMCESGIYMIRNEVTGNLYVGSTIWLARRWTVHRSLLRQGRHHSFVLQRAWNKHGEDQFAVYLIENVEADQDALIKREQYWLDALKPKYNGSLKAIVNLGVVFSDARRTNMARGHVSKGKNAEAWRINISAAKIGRKRGPNSVASKPFTDEHRARLAAAKLGKKRGPRSALHSERIAVTKRANLAARKAA